MNWVVVALLLVSSPVSVRASVADSLFSSALESQDDVSVVESISAFERVLEVDREHVPAMVALAKLHTSVETVEARVKAERLITRAMKLSPEDPAHRLALGDLMWAMQRKDEAEGHYLRVLDQDSTNARAAYKIGLLAVKEFLKYQNMRQSEVLHDGARGIRPTVAIWEWGEESDAVRAKAVRWLSRSIEFDPGFKDAYYQLGRLYLESGQPRGLLDLSKVLLYRDSGDVNGLLFSGLAQQRLGDEASAAEFYDRAIVNMSPSQREAVETLEDIVPRDEDAFHPSPKLEPEAFWRRQDPLRLTDYNERRLEHYGRVAYANLAFGVPAREVEGWQTDMGRTLIKFGTPRGKFVRRPEIRSVGPPIDAETPGGGLPRRSEDPARSNTMVSLAEHTETWAYEGFNLEFTNWGDGQDGWQFDTKYRGPSYTRDSGLATFTTASSRFLDPYQETKYESSSFIAGFRDGYATRVELSYAIPLGRIQTEGEDGFLSLEDGLFLFDEDWNEVHRDVGEHFELEPVADDSIRSEFLLATRELNLEPGVYHLVSEVMDRISGSIGTFEQELRVTHPDTLLAISDLLLAVRIESLTEFPENPEDLDIRPNPLRIYPRADPVRIYFEIYNLARNEFGRTKYDVSYRVGWPDSEEIDASLFPELLETEAEEGYVVVEVERRREGVEDPPYITPEGEISQTPSTSEVVDYRVTYVEPKDKRRLPDQTDRQVGETEVTAQYEGDREDDFTYLMVDASRMPAGVRKLTVTVRDRVGGGSVERETFFRLVE